eukprot:61101_1
MSQWKCIRCTLLNGHADDTCTVCDKKRDQPTESEDYEFAKRLQQQYNESTTSRTEPKSQKHTANHRMKQTSQPIHHYASNSQNSPFVCDNNPNHSYHNASHPSQSVKPLQSSHHSIFGASNEAQSTSFIFDDNATNQSGLSHVQPPAQSRSNNSSFAFEDDVDHSSHSTSYHSQHSVNHSSLSERQSTQPNNHSTFDNDNQRIVDYVFYDAIPKNRCISSSQMVIGKIFNENDEILHDECEPYNEPIPRLNVKLRENQKKGLTWLLSRENEETQDGVRGGLLCDETEMGKTVQILSLMLVQKQKNPNERTLIITPLNLVDRWIGEIRKIAPNSFTICHYYNQKRKKITKQDIEKCDVVLSTTDTFKKAMGKTTKMWNGYTKEMWMKAEKQELLFKLNKGFFDRIVVDESHEIKNIDTVRSRAICTMASRCKYKWCLTGTPVNNDITYDLGGVSRFLGIERNIYVEKLKLTDKEKKRYLNLSKAKKQSMWLDLSNDFCLNRVKAFIKPIMLRRVRTKKSQKRKKSRKRKPPTNQSVFPSVKRRKICDQQDHKPQPMPYKKARALHKKNNRFMGSSGSDRMDNENGNMNNIKPNVESHTQKMSVKQFLYNTIDGYKKHWANTFQFTNDELETTADGLFRMYRFSEMMHKHLQTIQTQCNIYTAIYDKEETESLMNTHGAIKNAQSKHNIYTLETIDWRKIQLEHWQKTNRLRTLKSLKRKADEFVNHKPQPTTPMLHRKRSGCIADSDSDNYHTDNENRFKPNAPHIPANDHAEYNYYNTNHNQLNALDPMDTDEDDEQQTKNDMANVSFISNVSSIHSVHRHDDNCNSWTDNEVLQRVVHDQFRTHEDHKPQPSIPMSIAKKTHTLRQKQDSDHKDNENGFNAFSRETRPQFALSNMNNIKPNAIPPSEIKAKDMRALPRKKQLLNAQESDDNVENTNHNGTTGTNDAYDSDETVSEANMSIIQNVSHTQPQHRLVSSVSNEALKHHEDTNTSPFTKPQNDPNNNSFVHNDVNHSNHNKSYHSQSRSTYWDKRNETNTK